MRNLTLTVALCAGLAAHPAAAIEPVLNPGEEIENSIEGDLNADGEPDLAYIVRTEDTRMLLVVLSVKTEVEIGVETPESLPLDPFPLGPGAFSFERGTLTLDDLTGGTTAVASTRRYRFDAETQHMRLIGLDATYYSRTYAHDGFELSWNLLTGDLITRELHLNEKGGDAAFDPIVEHKGKRRTGKVWLEDSPDPEGLIAELSEFGGV
jgi:hypothetical protein